MDWFKVDGTQNSADIPSEAHTKPIPALLNSKLWRKGEFMEKAFSEWPITQPLPPKYLNEVPGILPKYSSFANLELNNLLVQKVVDSEANILEEEELLDFLSGLQGRRSGNQLPAPPAQPTQLPETH